MGYAVGAMPIQAASAGADHLRDRYWFVADADDAHGVPNRVGLLRGFGNAIDHRPAKEFIQAYMTTRLGTEVTSHDGKVAT
jgi:hypothetical protein